MGLIGRIKSRSRDKAPTEQNTPSNIDASNTSGTVSLEEKPPIDPEKQVSDDPEEKIGSTADDAIPGTEGLTEKEAEALAEKHGESSKIVQSEAKVESDGAVTKEDGVEVDNTAEVEEEEDTTNYPGGFQLAMLTFGLMMAIFVIALDNTIIATAIPRITTYFDSLNDVGWYGSSYLLTTTSLQPSFGKIYANYNVKWTYMSALIIFELGSILCAAAKTSVMLIVGRAVAGAGAAALFSGGMTIVAYSVPLRKRSIYIAALSSMFGISAVVGPILGGALTDKASWRWCFWINLPFGAVALVTVFIFFKNPKREVSSLTRMQRLKEIDLLGAFLLICSIVCLLLALQWGGSVYPWHDSKVWGTILGFALIIGIFIFTQFRLGDKATIPPRIFLRQRTVLASCWYSCFLAMGVYTHIFYLPFYFQAVKGTTAEGSGIRSIPYLVSNTISSVIVGGLITAIGTYVPFMWFGAAVFTIGGGLLYTLKVSSGAGMWIGYQVLAGFGAGAGIQIPFIAVQVVLDAKDMPSGNALAIFFNTLGGAVSISIAQNIFSNSLIKEIPKYAPDVSAQTIISAGATHVKEVTPAGSLAGVLQAYDVAVTRAFILPIAVGGIATICSFFMEWRSVKGKKLMAGAA